MSDDFHRELQELLADLSEREQKVLRERFGIGFDPSLELRDVAARFIDIRKRIEAIERRALSRAGDDGPHDGEPDAPQAA